jgi:rSAM/selenodomain-associated transferase 1
MQFPDARILIFAKAPVPGQVKTRLAPRLNEQEAAAFHRKCVRYAVERRCVAELAPVVLYAAPSVDFPLFTELAGQWPLQLADQQGDDLGERMYRAVREQLALASAVLLTGTDAPALQNDELQQALAYLYDGADVVMQPAEDGGYVLLGLCSEQPLLFSDMPWGSDQVARLTRERCEHLGLCLVELPTSWDVDRPEDLDRLAGLERFSAYPS